MSTDPRADRIELNQDINLAWTVTLAQADGVSVDTLCDWFKVNIEKIRAANQEIRKQ